jgi:hypothetical protein
MYFISVTRLRVRSFIFLPQFFYENEASIKAVKKIDGFIAGKELIDRSLTFWTVTLWKSDQAMKIFRNNNPHKRVMRKLPHWCDEAAYVHWLTDLPAIPDWDAIHKKLLAEGKTTKVKYPSAQQAGMNYTAPVWRKIERPFKFK